MTLIIGIKCKNGIVLGADGGATLGTARIKTVMQPAKKLAIVSESMVIGVSGHVGLGQQFEFAVRRTLQKPEFFQQEPIEAGITIGKALWSFAQTLWQRAPIIRASNPILAETITSFQVAIALIISDKPYLFQFDRDCSPEKASDLPFFAIGSAQEAAENFLAFVRLVTWKDTIPSLSLGRFVVFWTLEHCIRTSPGGISEPKQIVVVENGEKGWQARELLPLEITDHFNMVTVMEERIEEFVQELRHPKEKVIPIP